MQALIKNIDTDKKLLDFRLIDGTEDLEYFNANGYTDKQEVEQCYTGDWYVKGYAPQKNSEELKSEVRSIRNIYIQQYDYTQLADAPFTAEEKAVYANYRQYLRDYTKTADWWESEPKTFDDWKKDIDNILD